MRKLGLPFGLLALLHVTTAHAYIGPGVGAGTIAIVLGILSSIFLAFLGILWYPFKRLLKRLKGPVKATAPPPNPEAKDSDSGSGPRDSDGIGRAPSTPGD